MIKFEHYDLPYRFISPETPTGVYVSERCGKFGNIVPITHTGHSHAY